MSDAAFVQWAREALVPLDPSWQDLAPLGEMIGDAPVVALSEGVHAGAEPLEFRNRLFQYLVRQKGFTAIAVESGIVEGRVVYDYVRGAPGDLDGSVSQGFSWTFDRLPQNRDLVRWLRQYNAESGRDRKINFYGFDVAGSPGNTLAHRGVDTALVEALKYLASVDRAAGERFHASLDGFVENLRFDLNASPQSAGYHRLSRKERDALTAAIADLITWLERNESQYLAFGGDYEWGYRAAIAARQTDDGLRATPLGWRPSPAAFPTDETLFFLEAGEIRDRAQADNLEWIRRQEGESGKILVFAHLYHLSGAAVGRHFELHSGPREYRHEVAGTYLKRRCGKHLVTIGNLIGAGSYGCAGYGGTLGPASADSLDRLVGTFGIPQFLLDFRDAPADANPALRRERSLGRGPATMMVAPSEAFDVLLYMDMVTRACADE